MEKYPKMKTLFKLTPSIMGKKKWDCTNGELLPDTAALHYFSINELVFTEKIDGTNMGVEIECGQINRVFKREGGAISPTDKGDSHYAIAVWDTFSLDTIRKMSEWDAFDHVTIFGEVVGPKVQKGHLYFPEIHFLVFDIYSHLHGEFFRWDLLKSLCDTVGLETVPVIKYPYQSLSVENVKKYLSALKSVYNTELNAEGFVVRHRDDTAIERRYMAKIRRRDFNM